MNLQHHINSIITINDNLRQAYETLSIQVRNLLLKAVWDRLAMVSMFMLDTNLDADNKGYLAIQRGSSPDFQVKYFD